MSWSRKQQNNPHFSSFFSFIGAVANKEDAARAYDAAVGLLGEPVNFPVLPG